MNAKIKKVLLILGGVVAAVILAVVVFALTFDINAYKPRIEAAASEALGMKVRINGQIKLSLFPRADISLEDILMQNNGVDIASAKKANVEIRLLPLIRRKILIRQVRIPTPNIFVARDKSGRFNFETTGKQPGEKGRKGFSGVENIFIEGGHVLYLDEKSGGKIEAGDCDLEVKNLSTGGEEFILNTLSFDGHLSCAEVKARELIFSKVDAVMKTHGGKFEANPFTMKIFGGSGKGSITGVMTGESPEYSLDFTITKFRFEEMLATFKQNKSMRGELDLKSHLAMKGKNANEMTRTAQGEISLRGHDLFLESLDLDSVLEEYEKSQRISLVDLGTFFVAGPIGAVLTKGYDFGSVYKESMGGKSAIQKLVSDWRVKNGIAEASDAAFTTRKNRVALRGRLDFVNEQFDNVTVAVLNERGCVKLSQKISGHFRHPNVEKASIFRTMAGPVLSLFEKTGELLKGGECEVFYAGSLEHPK